MSQEKEQAISKALTDLDREMAAKGEMKQNAMLVRVLVRSLLGPPWMKPLEQLAPSGEESIMKDRELPRILPDVEGSVRPLVEGGQGRHPDEIIRSAGTFLFCILGFAALLAGVAAAIWWAK